MIESTAMAYVKGYAESFGKQLKDEKTRLYYYYLGILSCCNHKTDYPNFQKEINELKAYINEKGINMNGLIPKMINYAKEMLKKNNIIDDFFILPETYLEKANQLAKSKNSHECKPIYLLEVMLHENVYWMDPNYFNKKIENNMIHDKLNKAFILEFYDEKNQLSYEVHIASNAKELILGRDTYADIKFDEKHNYISRKHCMITCFNNHYYLQDLGSTQSTIVNNILIGNKNNKTKKIELKHGDVISLSNKIKILVSILDIHKLTTKTCIMCKKSFLTSTNEDLCGMCSYEFSKDFGEKLTIQEVNEIPNKFNLEHKVYERKIAQKGGNLKLTFKELNNLNVKPVEKQVNELIPGYEFIKTIGEGGMGSVYLVKERKTGKLMALKTIKKDANVNEVIKETFKREAYIQQQMNHKYIAKQYDHGEYKGMLYILMEYYQHGTLFDYMKNIQNNKNKYSLLKELLIQILQGLDYLHHASVKTKLANGEIIQVDGVVHRDMKPQNIFVDFDANGKMMIKIADFGLSKAFAAAGQSGISKTGYAMGTFQFMPRQQLEDSKYAKPEVDIWAAVAIIYVLACGFVPKPFSENKDPILVCADEKAIPIKKRDWLFPMKFAKIIDQALDDDKDYLYYQEASDLINDLIKIKV